MRSKDEECKPGHIKHGALILVQTEETKKVIARKSKMQSQWHKLPKVELNWKSNKETEK